MSVRARGAALAVLLVAAMALVGARGPTPASAQSAPAATASAEESLLTLLPYRLPASALPHGFDVLDTSTDTLSSRAISAAQTEAGARRALQQLQRDGFIVSLNQDLGPNDSTAVVLFTYQVELFANARLASAEVAGNLDPPTGTGFAGDNPPLAQRLGDESGALHVTFVGKNGDNLEFEAISWRRGRVVFLVLMQVLDGTESLDQALPLAQAADQHAAAVDQAAATAAPQTVSGTEANRLDAFLALAPRLMTADQAPLGLLSAGVSLINNADLVAGAADPTAMLARLARWHRVAAIERRYITAQGQDGDQIRVQLALDADAAGVAANLADPLRPAGSSMETFGLVEPLGDSGLLYHFLYTGSTGVAREIWRAVWSHGTVLLSVEGDGAVGEFTAGAISSLAATADDRYQRGTIPDILTTPLAPNAPAPLPPPIS